MRTQDLVAADFIKSFDHSKMPTATFESIERSDAEVPLDKGESVQNSFMDVMNRTKTERLNSQVQSMRNRKEHVNALTSSINESLYSTENNKHMNVIGAVIHSKVRGDSLPMTQHQNRSNRMNFGSPLKISGHRTETTTRDRMHKSVAGSR